MTEGSGTLRFPILIGDIGGTNARFSIVLDANAEAGEPQIVQTKDVVGVLMGIQHRMDDADAFAQQLMSQVRRRVDQ